MATTRTVQLPSLSATTPTLFAADAAGDNFTPPGSNPVFLWIVNGSGSSVTATVDDPTSVTPEAATQWNPDAACVIPAGGTRLFKLGAVARFTDPTTGKVTISWSAVTSVTAALFA